VAEAAPDRRERREVGRIVKAHGIKGEVSVDPITPRTERFAPGAVLHAGERTFVVATVRPHQGRWLVGFEGVVDRTTAEGLRGTVLTADPLAGEDDDEGLDEDEVWVHDLVGAEVVDTNGVVLGRCAAVVVNPASDLLELESGALIPLVFHVEHGDGRVVVDPPPGLLDL
jgi:16S rRNA processing protein RimM